MPKYILFLVKLKGEKKAILQWKSINLSFELSLTCGDNVNYYKNAHYPIPTHEKHPSNFQNKSVSSAFNWVSTYILFLAKLKKRGRPFLAGARRGATLWDYPQDHLAVIRDEKVFPFAKLEMILPLLCFLLDPLTNKFCRTWSSMIKLWTDSRIYQSKESCCQQGKGLAIT